MSLFSWFKRRDDSAQIAKERLRIIVAQERQGRNAPAGPDYLPMLRRELLEVIMKYVKVDADAVQIRLDKEDGSDILEMNVILPDAAQAKSDA